MKWTIGGWLVCGAVWLTVPRPADAQTYWRFSSAAFGATAMGGTAWVAEDIRSIGCIFSPPRPECEARAWVPVAMGAAGAILGFVAGYRADYALAQGDTLSRWTRFRLASHLFLTPLILTPIVVSQLEPGETSAGLKWAAAGAGGAGGVLLQRRFSDALTPRITPARDGVQVGFSVAW